MLIYAHLCRHCPIPRSNIQLLLRVEVLPAQGQNNDKMIQEQKKIIQEQTEKKIKEQKVEFDAEISRKNKQIIEL